MTAIFFDRDGVVNRRRVDDYVKSWEEFEFLPEIFDLLPRVHVAGCLAVLVTNQRGIGRGLMSEEMLDEIHRRMQSTLHDRTGHNFDAIYHCPHHPEGVIPELAIRCNCRKPQPGMLLQAAADLDLDLQHSWFVGDILDDVEAGNRVGCHTVLVDLGTESIPEQQLRCPDYIVPDTQHALRIINAIESRTKEFVHDS